MSGAQILVNDTYCEGNRIMAEVLSWGFRHLSDEFKINIHDIVISN